MHRVDILCLTFVYLGSAVSLGSRNGEVWLRLVARGRVTALGLAPAGAAEPRTRHDRDDGRRAIGMWHVAMSRCNLDIYG